MSRIDGRDAQDLRPITILCGVNPYAEGSAEIAFGNTRLLISATVESSTPGWIDPTAQGWLTAEYGMLPRATHTRNDREAARGKQSGRTLEIQRLIGRALRAAIDLKTIPGLTIRLDCDVLCADGGTRTAAVTGAWIALAQAVQWAKQNDLLVADCPVRQVAAISVGIVGGRPLLDLCYEEDSQAQFDMNVVLDEEQRIIEVQGTAERATISSDQCTELLALATGGIADIMELQREAVSAK